MLRRILRTSAAVMICFSLLTTSLSSSALNAPWPAEDLRAAARPGSPILLRHDPTPSDARIAPPASFSALHIQTATINVNYVSSGSQDGYTCYAWPQEAKDAFGHAVSIWESLINSPVPISINACWTELSGNILGSSRPVGMYQDFPGAPISDTWYQSALAHALSGIDINDNDGNDYDGDGSDADAEMNIVYNRAFDWYFGTDGAPPADETDFASVVLHEICHGLGFAGTMQVSGSEGYWGGGPGGYPAAYDRFTEEGGGGSGTPLLSYTNGSTTLGDALTSGNVFFDGPNANAANGGTPPKLYTPASWVSGSSYSHLDYDTFNNTDDQLMVWAISSGESIHNPGDVTLGLLQDLGWTLSGSPAAPTVSSITPASGVNTGTVHITDLSGSDFQSGATVKLTKSGEDDIEASGETVVSPSQITCDFDLTGATTGAWDVVVINPDAQRDRLSGGFTVNADPSTPSVTSITPSTGVNTGTVQILDLSGSGFQSGATVKLTKSGESAINATSVAVINPSWIACELDLTGATAGPWHVVVTNPDSLSGVLTEGFTVTTSADGSRTIYLPLALKRYPPYPDTPMLHAINNSDGNGSYTVSWSSAYLADTYTLQEDDNQHFSSPTPVYAGSGTSTFLSGRAPGTYYYRVKATNSWQGRQLDSRWSPSRIARVLPPTTFYPAADTTIMRGTPDMNWGNMASMRLGYDYGGCDDSVNGEVARGLVRFDLSSIPAGAEIVEARLHVYFLRSCYFQGHSQARTVTIYRTKSSWSEGTVTWQGRPGYAESYGWASVGVTESSLGWHSMDVTNLVRKWVDGTSSNFGLTIRAPEGSGDDFIRFGVVASESSGTAYDPYLEVEYAGTHSSGEVRPARAERPALSADDVGFQDALDVAPPLLESGPERTLEGKTLFYRSRDLDQSD